MVTNHLANLDDQRLRRELQAMLDWVRSLPHGAIATGCHVGAHRAPTGAMILLALGGISVDAAVAHSSWSGAGWCITRHGLCARMFYGRTRPSSPRAETVASIRILKIVSRLFE